MNAVGAITNNHPIHKAVGTKNMFYTKADSMDINVLKCQHNQANNIPQDVSKKLFIEHFKKNSKIEISYLP